MNRPRTVSRLLRLPTIVLAATALAYFASWRFPVRVGWNQHLWFVWGGGQFGFGAGEERLMFRWETMTINSNNRAPIHWWFNWQSYPITGTVVQIPLWLLPAGALATLRARAATVRWHRRRHRRCAACGYDIKDLTVCPECGQVASR